MSIEQLFFELLRVSIGVSGCLSKTSTNEEWKALYDMAKKQSLVGVYFAGVQKASPQPSPEGKGGKVSPFRGRFRGGLYPRNAVSNMDGYGCFDVCAACGVWHEA